MKKLNWEVRQGIASAQMEGFTFTTEQMELVQSIYEGKVSVEDVLARYRDRE